MISRDYLDVKADPDVVFLFLANISEQGLGIKNKDPISRQVFFTTGMSLFSWGESVEVTVQQGNEGSRILFRGQGRFQLNITASPKGPIGQIVAKLKERFEIIT